MNFFKRLFGIRRPRPEHEAETSASAPVVQSGREGPAPTSLPEIYGPVESDAPIVMVPRGKTMMIMDRMSYEYQAGLAEGADPSQAELDGMLAKVNRLRFLSDGMMRDKALGLDVLMDTRHVAEITAFREALRIVEDPEAFGHCACLGGPTVECYAGRTVVATLSFHHGHGFRWSRWKHDARLADHERLLQWFNRHGIDPDPGKSSGDPWPLQLLAMADAERLACRRNLTWFVANCIRRSTSAPRHCLPTQIVLWRTASAPWYTAPSSGPRNVRPTAWRPSG